MDRLEEVASLICEDAGDTWDLTPDEYKESYNKLAKQICSLFPKPDESRSDYHAIIMTKRDVAKAQRDMTASIVRAEEERKYYFDENGKDLRDVCKTCEEYIRTKTLKEVVNDLIIAIATSSKAKEQVESMVKLMKSYEELLKKGKMA